MLPKQSYFIIAALLWASCHNPPAPQANVTPAPQPQPIANYPAGPDTSMGKPVADPNAKEGINIIRYKDGVIKAKGSCVKGLKDGEWQSFYENGKLWSDEYFDKGIRDGKITVWYNNGQKYYEGEYKEGKPINTWSYWGNDGMLLRTADYNKKASNTAL